MTPQTGRDERSFRYRIIGIFLITVAFVATDTYFVLSDATHRGQVFGRDFIQYWAASFLLHEGHFDVLYNFEALNAYLADLFKSELGQHGFFYPPQVMFFIQPLRFLPFLPSYFVWNAVTLLFYLVAIG